MTITIEITEEQAQQLTEEARRLHLTAEELAARCLFQPQQDYAFEKIARQAIQEDLELLKRLA